MVFGVRLDVGNAYAGYEVTPYFDSLLVKVCTFANEFSDTVRKMDRVLMNSVFVVSKQIFLS